MPLALSSRVLLRFLYREGRVSYGRLFFTGATRDAHLRLIYSVQRGGRSRHPVSDEGRVKIIMMTKIIYHRWQQCKHLCSSVHHINGVVV